MQRSAIQGSPDQLTAVTGVWHAGARRIIAGCEKFGASADAVHPFRRALDTLRVGHAFASELRTVRPEDIAEFAESTGDVFYAHTNPEAAAANEFFPGIVAHGYLLVSWAAGLFVAPGRSPVLANYGLENLRFITPVAEGDSVRVYSRPRRSDPAWTPTTAKWCGMRSSTTRTRRSSRPTTSSPWWRRRSPRPSAGDAGAARRAPVYMNSRTQASAPSQIPTMAAIHSRVTSAWRLNHCANLSS